MFLHQCQRQCTHQGKVGRLQAAGGCQYCNEAIWHLWTLQRISMCLHYQRADANHKARLLDRTETRCSSASTRLSVMACAARRGRSLAASRSSILAFIHAAGHPGVPPLLAECAGSAMPQEVILHLAMVSRQCWQRCAECTGSLQNKAITAFGSNNMLHLTPISNSAKRCKIR